MSTDDELIPALAAHLRNMPELQDGPRLALLKSLKLTIDMRDGRPAKFIVIPEWHLGPAAPTAATPPLDPAIVRRVNGSR